MTDTLIGWVKGLGEALAGLATYDNATTALSWVILAVPVLVAVYVALLGLSVLKAVVLIPAGRASRRAELAAWAVYYTRLDEKEELEAAVKAAKERHQADMKTTMTHPDLGSPDPVVKRAAQAAKHAAPQVCVLACQAEDKKVEDFERDSVKPAKKAADEATKDRRWYTMRTWRTEVMTS